MTLKLELSGTSNTLDITFDGRGKGEGKFFVEMEHPWDGDSICGFGTILMDELSADNARAVAHYILDSLKESLNDKD